MSGSDMFALLAGFGVLFTIICLLIMVAAFAGMWKVFDKAGEPGWAAIVPIYNVWVIFKITYGKGSKILWLFVPIANLIVYVKVYWKLAKAFGKGTGFAVGLILLCPVFLVILGFDDSQYLGVQ